MKRILLSLLLIFHLSLITSTAQTAKEVLDKCAATVSAKDGVKANFTMSSAQYGSASGNIAVKGQMFCAQTSVATMWFDGQTLWTYMAENDFINLYKHGFKYTMTKSDKTFNVHLTAKDKNRGVQEMFITVDKASYHPTEVKLLQKQKWTTFTISNLKVTKLSDDAFRFNSKDFPSAEVIDLR